MEHYLIRATIIPVIVEKIMDKFNIDYLTALDKFYNSDTAALLRSISQLYFGYVSSGNELYVITLHFFYSKNIQSFRF